MFVLLSLLKYEVPRLERLPMLAVEEISLRQNESAVTDLWRRNLAGTGSADPTAKLRLGYLENPAGEGVGLALRSDDADSPVGVICLHPRILYRGSRRIPAANMADFAVDGGFRTLGPALMLMKEAVALAARRAILLYGLPNRNSAAVCRRAGLNVMSDSMRRYARVLTGAHPLTRNLPPLVGFWLRPALTLALRLGEIWSSLTLSPRLRCAPTTFDDPAIQILWARRPDDLMLGERSAEMLRWRFGRDGRGDWNICLACKRDGDAVGYLIWRLNGGMAVVGDFYTLDPACLTAAMLNDFCRYARTQGAHSVSLEFFGPAAVVEQIGRVGLRPRGEDSIVVIDAVAAGAPELADAGRWYLTAFDNDAS